MSFIYSNDSYMIPTLLFLIYFFCPEFHHQILKLILWPSSIHICPEYFFILSLFCFFFLISLIDHILLIYMQKQIWANLRVSFFPLLILSPIAISDLSLFCLSFIYYLSSSIYNLTLNKLDMLAHSHISLLFIPFSHLLLMDTLTSFSLLLNFFAQQ